MKKAISTILATLIFLAVIGAYVWGVVKLISEDITIETLLLPFIILAAFSVISILLIVILIRRVKSINEESKKNYDDY